MSLISDLLSKIKQQEPKRNIPPLLKNAVIYDGVARTKRNRLFVMLSCVLAMVMCGIAIIYFLNYFNKPSFITPTDRRTPPEVADSISAGGLPAQNLSEAVSAGPSHKINEREKKLESTLSGHKAKAVSEAPLIAKIEERKNSQKLLASQTDIQKQKTENQKSRETANLKLPVGPETTAKQDKDYYLYAARTYERENNFQMALLNYRKVLAVEPENFMILNNVSGIFIKLGAYDEAVKYAEKALNIHKEHVPSLINLGVAYSSLGNYKEGEECLRSAVTLEPSNRVALMNAGLIFEKRQIYNKAKDYFSALSATGDAQGYMGLARISERQNKTNDAAKYYRAAMSIENTNSQIWNDANERLLKLMK